MKRLIHTAIAAILAGLVLTPASSADTIAKFNEAILAGDVKAATVAALGVWPSLDRTREDFPLIAKEFAYAAYRADDLQAAQTFAQASVDATCSDTPTDAEHAASLVLLRAVELSLDPAKARRDALAEALRQRMDFPGPDMISISAALDLTGFDKASAVLYLTGSDRAKDAWPFIEESARLGAELTTEGDFGVRYVNRMMQLDVLIAEFMQRRNDPPVAGTSALIKQLRQDVDDAPGDETAALFVPLYWQATAWSDAMTSMGKARRGKSGQQEEEALAESDPTSRSARMLYESDKNPCGITPVMSTIPYLISRSNPYYSGFLGVLILKMDINNNGRAQNFEVLASIPGNIPETGWLDQAARMRFTRGSRWDGKTCKLERQNYIITLEFVMGTSGR